MNFNFVLEKSFVSVRDDFSGCVLFLIFFSNFFGYLSSFSAYSTKEAIRCHFWHEQRLMESEYWMLNIRITFEQSLVFW